MDMIDNNRAGPEVCSKIPVRLASKLYFHTCGNFVLRTWRKDLARIMQVQYASEDMVNDLACVELIDPRSMPDLCPSSLPQPSTTVCCL
jgi:hypothetical protein